MKLEAVRTPGRARRARFDRARRRGCQGSHFAAERLDAADAGLHRLLPRRHRPRIPALPRRGSRRCEALADLGAKLAICTNKRTDLSVQLLEALGMAQRFSAIVGADAVAERKPHPDHYRAAVSRAGGVVRRSLMVGDTHRRCRRRARRGRAGDRGRLRLLRRRRRNLGRGCAVAAIFRFDAGHAAACWRRAPKAVACLRGAHHGRAG